MHFLYSLADITVKFKFSEVLSLTRNFVVIIIIISCDVVVVVVVVVAAAVFCSVLMCSCLCPFTRSS